MNSPTSNSNFNKSTSTELKKSSHRTIHNHDDYEKKEKQGVISKRRRQLYGLRGLVSLREALITIVACIPMFVSFGFNESSMVLAPVFCIIVANTISTWTAIINGSIIVHSTGVSSLYCYLVFLILPYNLYWISFIILFIFTFVIQSVAVGRRWFTSLSVKKILIDISVLLYFSPRADKNQQIWENFVISLFIFGSIFVVELLVLPTLASRLFLDKTAKTLDSTRRFFRGVGYQMEARINANDESNVLLIKNMSFNFPMFPETTEDSEVILVDPETDQIVSNQPIQQPPSITIQQLQPQQQQKQPSVDSPTGGDILNNSTTNVIKKEVKILPLSRSSGVERTGVWFEDPIEKLDNIQEDQEEQTMMSSPIKKKEVVMMSSIKIPDEQELQEMDSKLTNEINRLTSLLAEARSERWNAKMIPMYEQMLAVLEMNQKHLLSIKLAVQHGFLNLTGKEIILPMLPFLNSIIEEVYLQIGLMVEIIKHRYSPADDNQSIEQDGEEMVDLGKQENNNWWKRRVSVSHKGDSRRDRSIKVRAMLAESFVETEALIEESQQSYKKIVGEYQRSNLPTLPAIEITKVHFFIFGIFSFAHKQAQLTDIIYGINGCIKKYPVQLELIRYGIPILVMAIFIFFYKRAVRFGRWLVMKRQRTVSQGLKEISNYFFQLFFANNRWKFPLQLTVAYTSCVIAFYYFDGRRHGDFVVRGLWACATVGLVMSPSIGATITRGVHRVVGTVLGGLLGFLIALAMNQVPLSGRIMILLIVTFIWVFAVAFVQQDPRYSYAGAVAGLTYLIVAYGSFQTFNYFTALIRSFHIILGVLWVVVISYVVFPYFTYKHSKIGLYEISKQMSNTFTRIVENGLRVDGRSIDSIDYAKENQEISASISSIRMSLAKQKALLYDIRSEMLLKPNTSSRHYFLLVDHLLKTFTRLVATESSFHIIFSDRIIDLTNPIRSSVIEILKEMKRSTEDLKSLMYDEEKPYQENIAGMLLDDFEKLNTSFQANRHYLLRKKILFSLHPEMIQFGSGMYSIRDFIKHYVVVLNGFANIKKDRRKIKSIDQTPITSIPQPISITIPAPLPSTLPIATTTVTQPQKIVQTIDIITPTPTLEKKLPTIVEVTSQLQPVVSPPTIDSLEHQNVIQPLRPTTTPTLHESEESPLIPNSLPTVQSTPPAPHESEQPQTHGLEQPQQTIVQPTTPSTSHEPEESLITPLPGLEEPQQTIVQPTTSLEEITIIPSTTPQVTADPTGPPLQQESPTTPIVLITQVPQTIQNDPNTTSVDIEQDIREPTIQLVPTVPDQDDLKTNVDQIDQA